MAAKGGGGSSALAARPVAVSIPGTLNLEATERLMISQALEQSNGNRTQAAKKLGISRRTLHRKLKEWNLGQPEDAA
jgi:two-component system response regulator AtoC